MTQNADSAAMIRQADAAAARGQLAEARRLLEAVVRQAPAVEHWLKLGSICAALGEVRHALAAVEQALALAPLDFMGLLSRASLLERLGQDAGEAYGRALAQQPSGDVPQGLQRMIDHARQQFQSYQARRDDVLKQAMAAAEAGADGEERHRLARFRSNALHQTKVFHANPTHFHFPGLSEREFHDRSLFPWLAELEAATDVIAAECAAVMAAERAELVPYIQYAAHEPLDQWKPLNHSKDWTAIHLKQLGKTIEANARHCPATMALLDRLPQPQIAGLSPNAMFSLLAPNTAIPPHYGVTNTRLVCHLPLIVPAGCWFRVGAETRLWERGTAWVFDDSIEHEANNPSDQLRVILIVDVWHPGLSAAEQAGVRAMLEAEAHDSALAL